MDCSDGECECEGAYDDCDGIPENGCETRTASDPSHCGLCGVVCGQGSCVNGACPSKWPPQPNPDAPYGDGGPGVVLAMDRLLFGDTDRSFNPGADAWKEYGYDLDGLITTADLVDHCQPQAGAAPSMLADGPGGVDNGFHNILPFWIGLTDTYLSNIVRDAIAEGVFTYLLRIDGLGASGDYQSLHARWYRAKMPDRLPAFDGQDRWQVSPESLTESQNLEFTILQMDQSYVTGNTWVSTPRGTFDLVIKFTGYPMVLTVRQALITVDLTPGRTAGTNGIIAGVVETEQLVEEFRQFLAAWSADMCGSSTFELLAEQIRWASDSLLDGSQDPTRTCNAISVGFGFETVAAQIEGIGERDEVMAKPCP